MNIMKDRYSDYLVRLTEENKRICVLTAENRIFIKTVIAKIPHRFIDVGIAEQNLIGISAGLAVRGMIPIAHCLAAFLTMRAFEFIRTDLGYQRRNVKLIGTVAGFFSEGNGPTHQAIEDLSIMRGIPNMAVLAPSDIMDMELALKAAIGYDGPVYIRFNNSINESITSHKPFIIGKGEVMAEGKDTSIFTYGILLKEAISAAKELLKEGISVRVINMRSIKPIDKDLILKAAEKTGAIFTLEDHFIIGGLASAVAEVIAQNRLNVNFMPIGLDDRFFKPGKLQDVIRYHKMDSENIARQIRTGLARRIKRQR